MTNSISLPIVSAQVGKKLHKVSGFLSDLNLSENVENRTWEENVSQDGKLQP